ncbi:c-type cytochrome biogenesis protein CcmI [Alisedimentitalea sp. MJ-SS2]|uniref:c-type cytochrome biogenesis protein CcmI n=1 Tax=Aliisedimentitalea sp. MJ-SS2 TaxID=3049795 RepID=UPI002908A6AC|nr:c-type cytochrome biogenesis protein CcmI [Alisedimentitalea sp. MJ-SS2]MDU8928932.1 c-type cytochrome biogenesis protein CcmI [Alisedimentitalea sp. MJ-SS2]
MIFWITAIALAVVIATLLGLALLRTRADAEHPAAYDLRVYRDQLKEVDRDLARGVIGEGDAERIRAEVGRRVLAADAQLQKADTGADQPRGVTLAATALAAVVLIGGTIGIYTAIGKPGARDLPLQTRIAISDEQRKSRPTQTEAEAELPAVGNEPNDAKFAELMIKLRQTVQERPDDLQGHQLLARNEASLGNFRAAYKAQQGVIRIKGERATATDFAILSEMMITATEGYVSPEAEEALRSTLLRDPGHKPARYYTGLMLIQNNRPDAAFRFWSRLLEEGPPSAPWNHIIRGQIEELAWRAGVDYTPPSPEAQTPGPSAADMAAAAEMSPEERAEMIEGMVARLNERLATQGGSPEEWARLIQGLGILGDREKAAAIWQEAQQVFGSEPGAVEIVRKGAIQAGVAEAPDLPPDGGLSDGGLSGPTREDMQNAATMTAEERQEMIQGMVAQLAERLAEDGGSPAEWGRLITSQSMLGDKDAAMKALADARAAHAGNDTALAQIDAAARSVGLAE